MSVSLLLDELLAGFAPLGAEARQDARPANPANSANRQHGGGSAPRLKSCEGARSPANPGSADCVVESPAQQFADLRESAGSAESQRRRELSQDSQRSQGLSRPQGAGDGVASVEWSDGDISRFVDRRARLMRWGWTEAEAERMAERLTVRDRTADERVSCVECSNYRPGRCGAHRRAGLSGAALGRDLAATLQRCPGFLFYEVPK